MTRAILGLVSTLVLVGCGPPVGVTRVSPETVTRELTESALNSSTPSVFSRNVLHRWNLSERFRADPEGALRQLHQLVVDGRGRDDTVFALAELSFAHAKDTGKRDYYLQSAVTAWAFVFPGLGHDPPDELDPRLRIAADLYNRGLTQALASADGSVVDLRSGLYPLPFRQQVAVYLEPDGVRWAGRDLVEFVPVAELRVRGLQARHRRPGIGAPLAARAIASASRFVRLPRDVLGATADLIEGNDDALLLDPRRPRFGSVYGMRPGSPFLSALAAMPIAPEVAAHSIIPVTGAGPGPNATDGVVTFQSARIDGVETELVIPFSGHSVQGHPLAIEEVRRILLEHAAHVCRTTGVACGSRRESVS